MLLQKNVWLKYLRKHKETISLDDSTLIDVEKNSIKKVDIQWDQKEILQVIHHMNDPMREVMYLRLISNLSFAEIDETVLIQFVLNNSEFDLKA